MTVILEGVVDCASASRKIMVRQDTAFGRISAAIATHNRPVGSDDLKF